VPFTNVLASTPPTGGGYAGLPRAARGHVPARSVDANHSESWLTVEPGTEDLVGTSKFSFDRYSTFYLLSLGAYRLVGGVPVGEDQVHPPPPVSG
jgi:hypothetical protein